MSRESVQQNQSEAARLIELLARLADKLAPRTIKIMEICGTHTVTAQAAGLHAVLPDNVFLISGPGCPVCVTPAGYIEQAARLALERDVQIATYGDMVRVPGIKMSLEDARREGAKVIVVYSVQEALDMAEANSAGQVVFLGIGFETTTPATAYAVKKAYEQGLDNFLVLSAHKRIIPAMEVLLSDTELAIDGFIAPGHVSVIIGLDAYAVVAEKYGRPCVAAGFDGNQMLMSLVRILTQLVEGEPKVENVYRDRITKQGNTAALEIIDEIFIPAASRWRGMGVIEQSGLELQEKYSRFDARRVFALNEPEDYEPAGCRCAEVIKGICLPNECALFAKRCSPATPVGACMVSREGACSAYYKYRKKETAP